MHPISRRAGSGASLCVPPLPLFFAKMSFDISPLAQRIVTIFQRITHANAQWEELPGSVGQALRIQQRAPRNVDPDGSPVFLHFVNATLKFVLRPRAPRHPQAETLRIHPNYPLGTGSRNGFEVTYRTLTGKTQAPSIRSALRLPRFLSAWSVVVVPFV